LRLSAKQNKQTKETKMKTSIEIKITKQVKEGYCLSTLTIGGFRQEFDEPISAIGAKNKTLELLDTLRTDIICAFNREIELERLAKAEADAAKAAEEQAKLVIN
jgi:hypothetical protein